MPAMPAAFNASFTSSSLKGLTTAVMSFMSVPSVDRCRSGSAGPAARTLRWRSQVVVGGLGVQGRVQAHLLGLFVHPHPDGHVDHLGDHVAAHEGEQEDRDGGDDLILQELDATTRDEQA